MAWASTDLVPGSINLSLINSFTSNSQVNDTYVKVAPVNSGNTKFDFTAATGATVHWQNSLSGPVGQYLSGNFAPTITAHDATGLTLKLTASQVTTMMGDAGGSPISLTLLVTDGTTSLMAATGSANVKYVA